MLVSEEQIRDALKSVRYPGFSRDIVSFGLVKSVKIDNGEIKVQLALATNDPNVPATIKNDAENVLRAIDGVRSAKVLIDIHAPPAGAGTGVGATRIPGISTPSRLRAARAVLVSQPSRQTSRSRSSKPRRAA